MSITITRRDGGWQFVDEKTGLPMAAFTNADMMATHFSLVLGELHTLRETLMVLDDALASTRERIAVHQFAPCDGCGRVHHADALRRDAGDADLCPACWAAETQGGAK